MSSENSSPRPVAGRQTEWMIPSDQMVVRRYKPLRYFSDTLEDGFRAGQARTYEQREGRASLPTRYEEHQQSEETDPIELSNGEEMDLATGFAQVRKDARANYYANCWRLGTDEDIEIWEQYADIREGVAIETTFGQLQTYIDPDEDLRMGIVRYIQHDKERTPAFPNSVYFFKDRQFDNEQEFRILVNRGGNPILWADGRETPPELDPNNPEAIYLSADQDALINRVILAPEADDNVRSQVEEILEENNVSAPVVESRLSDPSAHHDTYDAELGGADNYGGHEGYLQRIIDGYVEDVDWDIWDTIDVVQINQEGLLHPRTIFIECYRYIGDPPDLSAYGQDHLNYEVRAHRVEDSEVVNRYFNDEAKESEAEFDSSQ